MISSMEDCWNILVNTSSKISKSILTVGFCSVLMDICCARSCARFKDTLVRWEYSTSQKNSQVFFAGKTFKCTSQISIHDIVLLKAFTLNILPPSPRIVKEVIWFLLSQTRTKAILMGHPLIIWQLLVVSFVTVLVFTWVVYLVFLVKVTNFLGR